jgi:hypothetical protein
VVSACRSHDAENVDADLTVAQEVLHGFQPAASLLRMAMPCLRPREGCDCTFRSSPRGRSKRRAACGSRRLRCLLR